MSRSYNFIDHTADIAAEINGSSLEELFLAGADAWLDSIVGDSNFESDDSIEIDLFASSGEELLVSFLNELNYLLITKKWLSLEILSLKIDSFEENWELSAELGGTEIKKDLHLKNEIKSVTYHQVEIVKTNGNYSTLVVFDI